MNPIKIWWLAFRPKTLFAALGPVMIGTAMAFNDGLYHIPSALLALAGALLLQIGTNLANDYFDFKKGADNDERKGPMRVTQAGLVTQQDIRIATIITFGLAAIVCELLVLRAGWPLVIIGITSILSGIFYTAGPKPLGYLGLGELFVLIFFGPVAVAGTYYVQALEVNNAVIIAGLAPGFLSCAILAVNNLRDMEGDRKAGKKTLAVRFGRNFAIAEYMASIFIAALIPVIVYCITNENVWAISATVILFLAISPIKIVSSTTDGPALNQVLGKTGKLLFLYSFIYSVGTLVWVIDVVLR